jgi:hypothetical protein
MTAVDQVDLGVWHDLAIPPLTFAREQNIDFPLTTSVGGFCAFR